MGQDGSGFPQAGQHDAGGAGQQLNGVHMHDRVMAGIDDAGSRHGLPGNLVHVPTAGDAGADLDDPCILPAGRGMASVSLHRVSGPRKRTITDRHGHRDRRPGSGEGE